MIFKPYDLSGRGKQPERSDVGGQSSTSMIIEFRREPQHSGWLHGLLTREALQHLDQLVAAVAVATSKFDELSHLRKDSASFR